MPSKHRSRAGQHSRELDRRFVAKLAESGLTRKDAAALGFQLLGRRAASGLGPNLEARGGFLIPYHDLDGEPVEDLWRFRYLEDPVGFGAATASPRRYAQLAGTAPGAYFPWPRRRWRAVADDGDAKVIITEGELKAASATKLLEIPTIGLGGVSAYQSARAGWTFLPELEAFDWETRPVYLCFDSDVRVKAPVRMALERLALLLVDRGALVYEVVLPDPDGDGKTGLDDFLVANGPEAFKHLMEAAEEFAQSSELHKLNTEVALVRELGDIVVDVGSGIRRNLTSFKTSYANRIWTRTVVDAKGNARFQSTPAAEGWLRWAGRGEVRRLTYLPGADRPITADGDYNLWRGLGAEPAEGELTLWHDLLGNLFGEAPPEVFRWFERWMAYPLQQPGTKLQSGVLVWGSQSGTGKSLLGYTLGEVYGWSNFAEVDPPTLRSDYNDWATFKQFALVDEMRAAGGDRRADSDLIKRLITRRDVRVNQKYERPFVVPCFLNFYLTSNHPDALYLDPYDRRFLVHEAAPAVKLTPKFVRAFREWVFAKNAVGPAAILHHLLSVDLGDFDPGEAPPVTDAKLEMIDSGASALDTFARAIADDPQGWIKSVGAPPSDLWTAKQLLAIYDPDGSSKVTPNGLTCALKRAGLRSLGKVRVGDQTLRLVAIDHVDRWTRASSGALAAEYVRHFGDGHAKGRF